MGTVENVERGITWYRSSKLVINNPTAREEMHIPKDCLLFQRRRCKLILQFSLLLGLGSYFLFITKDNLPKSKVSQTIGTSQQQSDNLHRKLFTKMKNKIVILVKPSSSYRIAMVDPNLRSQHWCWHILKSTNIEAGVFGTSHKNQQI